MANSSSQSPSVSQWHITFYGDRNRLKNRHCPNTEKEKLKRYFGEFSCVYNRTSVNNSILIWTTAFGDAANLPILFFTSRIRFTE